MAFEYLGNPYKEQKTVRDYQMQDQEFNLKQELGRTTRELDQQKIQQGKVERAVQYLGMATPENWNAIRQRAIQEGLAGEEEIPPQYDENWINQTKEAFGSAGITPYQKEMLNLRKQEIGMKQTPQWEAVDDPMFGKGQKNAVTGEFKPVKTDVADPVKAEAQKQAALSVVTRLLENKKGVKANRGGVSTLFPNVSDSSVNAEADLDTLASLLTVDNLGLLKGVLSDTDMKILKDIGAGGLKGADAQVLGNLETIRAKLSGQGAPQPEVGGIPQGWTVRKK